MLIPAIFRVSRRDDDTGLPRTSRPAGNALITVETTESIGKRIEKRGKFRFVENRDDAPFDTLQHSQPIT